MKIQSAAKKSNRKADDQEVNNGRTYKAGWQTHPGTNCGHFFPEGETRSSCRRETRTTAGVKDDCNYKCGVCKERSGDPANGNLFT